MAFHSKNRSSGGFALVIALSLMAFVVLLLLGLSAQLRVETKAAASNIRRLEAEQNALLGLKVALGKLQEAAGPDQRVTATADILDRAAGIAPGNRRWTGVWDNRMVEGRTHPRPDDSLDYGANRDGAGRLDGRAEAYSPEDEPNGARWLLSPPRDAQGRPRPLDPATPLAPDESVVLAPDPDPEDGEDGAVRAGLGPIESAAGDPGRSAYAWWVGDGGVKARVNLPADQPGASFEGDGPERLLQQLTAAVPAYADARAADDAEFGWLGPFDAATAGRVRSLEQVFPAADADTPEGGDARAWRRRHFHDVTTHSLGLLTDTRRGGLKVDLSRALEEQWPEFLRHLARERGGSTATVPLAGEDWAAAQPLFVAPFPDGASAADGVPSDEIDRAPDGTARINGPLWDILYHHYHAYKPRPPYNLALRAPASGNNGKNWKNFFGWEFAGYAGASLPSPLPGADLADLDAAESLELTDAMYPGVEAEGDLTDRGPPGLKSPPDLPGVVQAVSSGPAMTGLMTPDGPRKGAVRNFWARESDMAAGEVVRDQNIASRQDPVWDARVPQLVLASLKIAFSSERRTSGDPPETVWVLNMHLYPTFVLWNPYNVELGRRQYRVRANFLLPMQVYYDEDGDGNADESELILENRSDRLEYDGDHYGLDPHQRGIFLHRLLAASARGRIYPDQTDGGFPGSGVNPMTLATEPISIGPGQFVVLSSPENAPSKYLSFDDTFRTEGVDSGEFRMENLFDTARGFTVNLAFTPGWRYRGGRGRDIGQDDGLIPVRTTPVEEDGGEGDATTNNPGVIVRFFDTPGSRSGPTGAEELNTQGTFQVAFPQSSRAVRMGSGTEQVRFLPADGGDKTVELGPVDGMVEVVAGTFAWRQRPTEGGGSAPPLYSALNPRHQSTHPLLPAGPAESAAATIESGHRIPSVGSTFSGGFDPQDLQVTQRAGRIVYFGGGQNNPGGQTSVPLYDVPRQPMRSIGEFMHANLSLFDAMPSYAVGGGFAQPFLDSTEDYASFRRNDVAEADILVPDVAYLANDALFDRYFFSTVPVDPDNAGDAYNGYDASVFSDVPPFAEFDANFVESGRPLPNPRMRYLRGDEADTDAYLDRLRDNRGDDAPAMVTAASELGVAGAFNVNSTSETAWTAFLAGMRQPGSPGLDFYDSENGSLESAGSDALGERAAFPRFAAPAGSAGDAWRGFAALAPDEIRELAAAIVEEVKTRGPFLSLADFVNRRLDSGQTGEKGALQAAIDATSINGGISGGNTSLDNADDSLLPPPKAGLPGFLLQNDLLRALAPFLRVRSDTFTIRAYGESRGPGGGRVRAWCEAVVQRTPAYVDAGADAPEAALYENAPSGDYESALAPLNERFGRRYQVVGFRWLNPEEL